MELLDPVEDGEPARLVLNQQERTVIEQLCAILQTNMQTLVEAMFAARMRYNVSIHAAIDAALYDPADHWKVGRKRHRIYMALRKILKCDEENSDQEISD